MITSRALKRFDGEVSQILEHANDLIVRVSTETVQKAETVIDASRRTLDYIDLAAEAHQRAADRWTTVANLVLVTLAGAILYDVIKAVRSVAA